MTETEMCTAQVFFIEEQIKKDLKLFPQKNVMQLHFRDLSIECVRSISEWINAEKKKEGKLPDFLKDDLNGHILSKSISFNTILKKYPFDKELFE